MTETCVRLYKWRVCLQNATYPTIFVNWRMSRFANKLIKYLLAFHLGDGPSHTLSASQQLLNINKWFLLKSCLQLSIKPSIPISTVYFWSSWHLTEITCITYVLIFIWYYYQLYMVNACRMRLLLCVILCSSMLCHVLVCSAVLVVPVCASMLWYALVCFRMPLFVSVWMRVIYVSM